MLVIFFKQSYNGVCRSNQLTTAYNEVCQSNQLTTAYKIRPSGKRSGTVAPSSRTLGRTAWYVILRNVRYCVVCDIAWYVLLIWVRLNKMEPNGEAKGQVGAFSKCVARSVELCVVDHATG